MFRLTDTELQNAYEAIRHHGHSALVPPLHEWVTVEEYWPSIRDYLAGLDLDMYKPHKPLRVVAPKSRANIRIVRLLHPEDLIIYTALVLLIKDDLERARISRRARRVFSYRASATQPNRLYDARGTYAAYLTELKRKAAKATVRFVATADIADFYPRIYQHRLENIVTANASSQRSNEVARVLVRKLITQLMENNSYGIPVGPPASRILGEGVLIDVDAHLQSQNVDYVRWVDDYHIFCRSEYAAQSTLFELAERLFVNHGLTLQTAKTKIFPVAQYTGRMLTKPEDEITERDTVIALLGGSEYGMDDPDAAQVQEMLTQLQQVDLEHMLEAFISDEKVVDCKIVRYVLTRLPKIPGVDEDLLLSILDFMVGNAELFYPVVEQMANFVMSFKGLSKARKRMVGRKLLAPLKSRHNPPPPYYAMWILHVFASSPGWVSPAEIAGLYHRSMSDVTKRYSAVAIGACGNRAEAVGVRDDIGAAASLVRLGILAASVKLGTDERKHWKRANPGGGVLEKYM